MQCGVWAFRKTASRSILTAACPPFAFSSVGCRVRIKNFGEELSVFGGIFPFDKHSLCRAVEVIQVFGQVDLNITFKVKAVFSDLQAGYHQIILYDGQNLSRNESPCAVGGKFCGKQPVRQISLKAVKYFMCLNFICPSSRSSNAKIIPA